MQALNESASSFPSFSSESSFMSAAQEALTAAINTPVPALAAQKPNGSAQWDVPPPSASHPASGNIWGTDTNVSFLSFPPFVKSSPSGFHCFSLHPAYMSGLIAFVYMHMSPA